MVESADVSKPSTPEPVKEQLNLIKEAVPEESTPASTPEPPVNADNAGNHTQNTNNNKSNNNKQGKKKIVIEEVVEETVVATENAVNNAEPPKVSPNPGQVSKKKKKGENNTPGNNAF